MILTVDSVYSRRTESTLFFLGKLNDDEYTIEDRRGGNYIVIHPAHAAMGEMDFSLSTRFVCQQDRRTICAREKREYYME